MNRDQFERAMDNVDEKFVTETATYKKPALRRKIIRIGSLAACAVLVMAGVVGMLSNGSRGYSDASYVEPTTPAASEYRNGSNYYSGEDKAAEEPGDLAPDKSPSINKSNAPDGIAEPNQQRDDSSKVPNGAVDGTKIIYTAKLTLESKEFDKSFDALDQIVKELGGYFEDQSVYDQGSSIRMATMTIRVPQNVYQTALERIKSVAHVTYSNQTADNVSQEYYDISSRLDTAKIKLERLQALLAEATEMTDIIELENAISEVEWQIDYYSGSLRQYDSLIDYSSITLELREVLELTDTSPEPVSFGERIKNSFVRGFENIGDGLVTFVEWFVGNIIWIALIAVAITIAVKVIKKKRRSI